MVNAGLIIAGNPISWMALKQSSNVSATTAFGLSIPILLMASLKSLLSSAISIECRFAPIISTPYFFRVPASSRANEIFRPVWPPMVGSRASGRSFSIILVTNSTVIGSIYVASAISGSVIIVAGFEFTKITL